MLSLQMDFLLWFTTSAIVLFSQINARPGLQSRLWLLNLSFVPLMDLKYRLYFNSTSMMLKTIFSKCHLTLYSFDNFFKATSVCFSLYWWGVPNRRWLLFSKDLSSWKCKVIFWLSACLVLLEAAAMVY